MKAKNKDVNRAMQYNKGKKMKKHSSILFTLVLILSLLAVVLSASGVSAQTLYEFYDNFDIADGLTSPTECLAQTFTVATEYHTVSQVSLYLKRDGNPGTITVSLKATDISGRPTGPDLATTYVPEAEIPLTPSWVNIIIGPHDLALGTKYAIVVRASNPSSSNELWWYSDTGQYYTDGDGLYSWNSGADWVSAGVDRTFGVRGDLITTTPTGTGTGDAGFGTNQGTIESLTAVDESTLPTTGKPDVDFPHGFFSFEITGLSPGDVVTVTLILPEAVPVGTQYWKYHADSGWYRIMPVGDDDGDNIITFNLIDGTWGHDDDGEANGVIVDQGGPGVPPPITADFSGTPTSGPAPLTVDFTDLSTGEIDTWSWDFGDTGTSTAQHPSHLYYTPGDYTVSLTVTGPGGSDTETKVDYIHVSESATEVWVDDDWASLNPGDPADGHTFGYDAFATIQDGIDAVASSTMHVADGTYNENVDVDKSDIIIRSDNGSSATIVRSNTTDMHVFSITDQTNVTLEGFTIRDAYGTGIQDVAGIYMGNASDCSISNNVITNISAIGDSNAHGIWLNVSNNNRFSSSTTVSHINAPDAVGIFLEDSGSNTFSSSTSLSNITADLEAYGILLRGSDSNTFNSSTSISYINAGDDAWGIALDRDSDNNEFYDCTISDLTAGVPPTSYGVYIAGGSDNNIISRAKIFRGAGPRIDYGITMRGCFDNFILYSNVSDCNYGIHIDDDSPGAHTMSGNTIYDNTYGIYLIYTWDNIITENEIRDNGHGVWVEDSNNNTIERNMIVNNTAGGTGVHITDYSDENEIHENCFIGNEPQAWDDFEGFSNNWTGNYWSDYTPPGPYSIEGNANSEDSSPLDECPLGEGPPTPARVPALTPIGIIALIGLLSVIAAMNIRRKKIIF